MATKKLHRALLVLGVLLLAALIGSVAAARAKHADDPHHPPKSPECRICAGMIHVGWAALKVYNSSATIMAALAKEGCGLMSDPEHRDRCVKCVEKFRVINRDVVNSVVCHLHDVCYDTGFCEKDDDDSVFRPTTGVHTNKAHSDLQQSLNNKIKAAVPQCGKDDLLVCPNREMTWRNLDRGLYRHKKAAEQWVTFEETVRTTRSRLDL